MISKEKKSSGKLISKIQFQVNEMMQKLAEESLSLSTKMESKVTNYGPQLKKLKQKYADCANTLEHYRQKVALLKKNVDKQNRMHISQDEHERFVRVFSITIKEQVKIEEILRRA